VCNEPPSEEDRTSPVRSLASEGRAERSGATTVRQTAELEVPVEESGTTSLVFVDGGCLEVEGTATIDEGGGLFTAFPVILEDSSVTRNSPDQCVGC
jgi:hypothetical protein